jgi:hypothetical protein
MSISSISTDAPLFILMKNFDYFKPYYRNIAERRNLRRVLRITLSPL